MATHHKTELSLDDGSTYVVATADIEAGPNLSFVVTGQLPGSYVCRLRITPVAGGTPVVSDSFVATFGVVSANGSQSFQLENASAVTSMLASVASNQSIQSETLVAVSLQMASVASLQSGQTEEADSPNYNAIIAESIQASQLESVVASMLQNGIVVASQSVQSESITSIISRSGTLASVQAVQAETIIEKTSSLTLTTSAQSAQTEIGVEVSKSLASVASIQAAQSESVLSGPVADYFGTTDDGWTISVIAGGDSANPSSTAAVATVTASDGANDGGSHNTSGTQKAVKGVGYTTSYYDGENTIYFYDGMQLRKTGVALGSGNIIMRYKVPAGGRVWVVVNGVDLIPTLIPTLIYDNQWHQLTVAVDSVAAGNNSGSNKTIDIAVFGNVDAFTDDPGGFLTVWVDDITLP